MAAVTTFGSGESDRSRTGPLQLNRHVDRQGAAQFVTACRDSDLDGFHRAVAFLDEETTEGWRLAMRAIARLPGVSDEIRQAFQQLWITSKDVPQRVGHQLTLAKALYVLMPPVMAEAPLRLFRGTATLERQCRRYGFTWTTHREVARRFAEEARCAEDGSVILETLAPPDAIHLRMEAQGDGDVDELVVDPYRLLYVRVVERLPSNRPAGETDHGSNPANEPLVKVRFWERKGSTE